MSVVKALGQQNTFYYTASNANRSAPVAVVLGWAGSVDVNVKKYANIYESFGYHTLRFAPTLRITLFQTHLHKKLAQELLELLLKHQLTKNPILIHTFSNAGLFIYRHVSEIVHAEGKYEFFRQNFKTLIADSGPGFPDDVLKLVQSIAELMEGAVNIRLIRYALATTGLVAFAVKNNILFNSRNYFSQFLDAIAQDKFQVPTLVFYSRADQLVSWKHIIDYVESRRKRMPVTAVEFADAEHVMNYVKHPSLYLDSLLSHLRQCQLPVTHHELTRPPLIKSQL